MVAPPDLVSIQRPDRLRGVLFLAVAYVAVGAVSPAKLRLFIVASVKKTECVVLLPELDHETEFKDRPSFREHGNQLVLKTI